MTGHITSKSWNERYRAIQAIAHRTLQAAARESDELLSANSPPFHSRAHNEEVMDMYFTKTKLARSAFGATLLAALLLSAPAFAANTGEATLANNERAAQGAIADSPTYSRYVRSDSPEASLAHNERAAQLAITETTLDSDFANPGRASRVSGARDEATLIHNERSAQQAIVDASSSRRFSSATRSSAALNSSASNQPAAAR